MQSVTNYFDTQERLWEMYESAELFNEGILSFEFPLYHATDEEIEYFLGKLTKRLSRGVANAARAAGKVSKAIGKGINTVTSVVPFDKLTSGLALTPLGMVVRTGLAAASAAAKGKNVFQAAARSVASTPLTKFAVDTASGVARGQNVFKSIQKAGQAGVADFKENLKFAATVAPFVPGLGTAAAAALATANALASGERISDALIAGARNSIPGGAIARSAFDLAANVVQGKSLSAAALNVVRSQIPGGSVAKAAFDSGLALAKGKSLQDSILAGGGQLLPKSPFTSDVTSFVKKVAAGENVAKAALSSAGNLVVKRIQQQAGNLLPPSLLPASPLAAGVTSFARRVASGENLGNVALGAASGYAQKRLGNLNLEIPAIPSSFVNSSGVWRREGNLVVVSGS